MQNIEAVLKVVQSARTGVTSREIHLKTGLSMTQVWANLKKLQERYKVVREYRFPNSLVYVPYVHRKEQRDGLVAKANQINKMAGVYEPPVWGHVIARPSSQDHEAFGSRFGDKIFHRDGRVVPA